MSGFEFTLNGAALIARPSGALWWPDRRLLCISDLHLGKSERIARRGGTLLPPYDTRETLIRLREEVELFDPWTVICLGDSFDDVDAEAGLGRDEARMLLTMLAGRRWVWIAGNHDPGPVEIGGTWVAEHVTAPLIFRHIAEHSAGRDDGVAAMGEVSGHYHPKARVPGHPSRPCFLVDDTRLILPAFGAYTGGLSIKDPAISTLITPGARALMTGQRVVAIPA